MLYIGINAQNFNKGRHQTSEKNEIKWGKTWRRHFNSLQIWGNM